jgi:threonine dehydrogenase-like Zn-dependent dehydrogenase
MRAMTVVPGQKGTAGLEAVPGPDVQDGALLVRGMAIGICGTDREIAEGAYGTPPSGEVRLVIGAGPIGLMACLLGAQRGYEMHVVDLARTGPKRDLVEDLGARYHSGDAADIDVDVDVVIECTGLGAVGRSAARRLASGGIMCLTDRDPEPEPGP